MEIIAGGRADTPNPVLFALQQLSKSLFVAAVSEKKIKTELEEKKCNG